MISFILVETENDENIGASARALKNFGFTNLVLVNPMADHQSKAARALAHGAVDVLKRINVYNSLNEAIENQHLVIGTTQRPRKAGEPLFHIREIEKELSFIDKNLKTSIVFGSEGTGLTNDHLQLCHYVCSIPTITRQPSLNLSQAVMLFSYELSHSFSEQKIYSWDPAEQLEIARLKKEFNELLLSTDFPAANAIEEFTEILFRSLKRSKLEKRDIYAWLKFIKHLKMKTAENIN